MARRTVFLGVLLLLGGIVSAGNALSAPAAWWDAAWTCRHRLEIPARLPPLVDAAVCELTTFGKLRADRRDLRIVTSGGDPRPYRILQDGPGDRIEVLFSPAKGEGTYYAYFGNPRAPDPPDAGFDPDAALVIEVRDLPPGPFLHAPEMLELWEKADHLQGRALVERVFQGTNPVGPATTWIARYVGHLRVPVAGAYRVVTTSSDASCVLVDGKVVAEWGGVHHAAAGRTGRFGSTVEMTAGVHRIDYLWVKASAAAPPAAVLGLARPGDLGPRLVPRNAFLHPVEAKVFAVETSVGEAPLDFTWQAESHVERDGLAAVLVDLRAAPGLAADDGSLTWSFPDGSHAKGGEVRKVFFGTGPVAITLQGTAEGRTVSGTLTVGVEPVWTQVRQPEGKDLDPYRKGFDEADPSVQSAGALAAMIALADDLDQDEKIPSLWQQLRARPDARRLPGFGPVCETLGTRFLRPPLLDADRAEEALRLGVASAQGEPERLRCLCLLADMLVNVKGDVAGADAFLPQLAPLRDDRAGRRKLRILEGDIAAEKGDADAARKRYDEAGATARPWDPRVALRRSALRFSVGDWLRRRQFAGAAEALEDWLEGQPADRLDPDLLWLLGRADAGLGFRSRAAVLFERALRLDPWGTNAPGILLDLADLDRERGDAKAASAHETLLLQHFPYSEEAARLHARAQGIRLQGD